MTNAELQILKTEITTDPMGLGYGTDDPICADLLNEIGLSGEEIPNVSVSPDEIADIMGLNCNELGNIPTNELLFLLWRMENSPGGLDISDGSPLFVQISKTFSVADAPNARAALILLKDRPASRAEVLFGAGTTVRHVDVGRARLI